MGFTVGLDAAPGTLMARIRALERAIEDYDQVPLLDWLVDRPGLLRIRPGALRRDDDGRAGYLQAASGDIAVIGATLLYRLGRLKAEQYLQILGGLVRADVH